MKLQANVYRKLSRKLNDFIQIPADSQLQKRISNKFNQINSSEYTDKSRLGTDKLAKGNHKSRLDTDQFGHQTNLRQILPQRQFQSSSFYDTFQFVDSLTNNKVIYRDFKKGSNSLIQTRNPHLTQHNQRPNIHLLLQLYSKTKSFQMKSLKKKIFNKVLTAKSYQKITPEQIQFTAEANRTQTQFTQVANEKKYYKSNSLLHLRQQTPEAVVQRSRQKNSLRSFLDKTLIKMNKAELKRIFAEKNSVKDQILQLNEHLVDIKRTMDKDMIQNLLYLREQQDFQMGKNVSFRENQKPIVFKDSTNQEKLQNKPDTSRQIKVVNERLIYKQSGNKKTKNIIQSERKDKFLQKMLNHARNHIKNQGQYLIQPNKQNLYKKMLTKKFPNKQFTSNMKTYQKQIDLTGFSFQKKPQSSFIAEVKSLVLRQPHSRTFIETIPKSKQDERKVKSKQDNSKNNIIFLIKNNYVSTVGIELAMNPNYCWTKDGKGNNLLHLAVKYERPQIIEMILKKLPYRMCRSLLIAQNSHKRTPLEMAINFGDLKVIQIIEKFILDNKQKDVVEGWITNNFKQT